MDRTPDKPPSARTQSRPVHSWITTAIDRLRAFPPLGNFAATFALLAALGVVDYWAEPDLSFLVFYLVPIFLATLGSGLWGGIVLSVAGTAVWFIANVNQYAGKPDHVIPFWNLLETFGVLVLFAYIFHALVRALEREREMARYDPLTGVANRRYFLEALEREILRSRRYGRPFTLAYLDLDDFKAVNDRLGHADGDALLCRVADTLLRGTRQPDTPARLGGDEFALLLPETGYDAARTVMTNIHGLMATALGESGWPVTFTMGAVTCTNPSCSAEELIGVADRLMYSRKTSGKGGFSQSVLEGREVQPPREGQETSSRGK